VTATLDPAPTAAAVPTAARGEATVLPGLVALTVCLLPFLTPAGPGNTAVADVGMGACLVVAVLWASRANLPVRLPYLLGVSGLVLGGAFAAVVSGAPLGTGLVLAQDVFLVLWAAVLALGRHNVAIVSAVTVAWCRMAPVYAGVMVVAYVLGLNAIAGVTATDGVRASYTFGDPNLAGNYLVVSLLMMVACKRPRSTAVRVIGYLLVLAAIGFTGSNGAMLTLVTGMVACFTVARFRRGMMAGVTALAVSAALVVLVSTVILPVTDLSGIREQAAGSIPLLRDSLGRSDSSSSERATIVDEGYRLFLSGDATGVGPARTKASLESAQAPYVKEAHNDYLATLLERGVIGALGLIALGAAISIRCVRLATGRLPAAYAAAVPRYWLLVTVAPVMAIAAGFYEVLHFRHLWTWLGLVAALVLAMQDASEDRR
jgi:O-antigen ligase